MALIKGESEEVWQCLGWDGNEEPCPGYVREGIPSGTYKPGIILKEKQTK
jgi:hypothetical protein